MRKKIMMLPVVLFFFFVFSVNNIYAADCASATIKRVGNNPATGGAFGASPYMVQLDCSNDATWPGAPTLYLSADLGEAGLATLLTAYSLGKTVWVRTLGVTPGSIVTIIYMND
jgi:hypothetical protein